MNDKKNEVKAILEQAQVPDKLSPEAIKEMLDKEAKPDKRKISVQRKIIKITSLAAVAALAVGISGKLYYDSLYYNDENISISNMKYAGSYDEIYEYLKLNELAEYHVKSDDYDAVAEGAVEEEVYSYSDEGSADGIEGGIVGEVSNGTDDNSALTSPETEKNYTETYNQEEGVNEADIVKTDGSNIYYCSDGSIRTAKVENGKFISSDVIAEDIGSIKQMYLYDDKLIVISSENDYNDYKTLVTFYSKGSNKLIGQYSQHGYFQDIRLMDDGYMYLISEDVNYNFYYEGIEPKETEKYIPSYVSEGEEIYLECDDILLSTYKEDYTSSFINLTSFDINSDSPYKPVDVKAVAGTSGDVYCSQQNLYIAYGWENTEITRFMIDKGKIIPKAGTSVRGYIKDQFSMSEYDGYFRIATTFETMDILGISSIDTNNCIYVLDMNLEQVGYITGLGPDETIKSVSFDRDKAYVVTFRQTDPLYSVDLSDPANPVLMDELKITGYSSYMQKWQDGMLLGFGESGNEEGDLYGLKLSMFDNSDPDNLKVLDSVEINSDGIDSYVYSQALYDRKALLISPEHNIIGFPLSSESWHNDIYQLESAYVFYSFENGKFKELGIMNYAYDNQYLDDSFYYSAFDRALIIDDYVYALSSELFISADIENIRQTDVCKFPADNTETETFVYD